MGIGFAPALHTADPLLVVTPPAGVALPIGASVIRRAPEPSAAAAQYHAA